MIDLYYWPTPNGHKLTIFLEETGLPYTLHPVNIGKGDQFKPEFLAISPNNKMPAIVDHDPADGGEAISIFESGAILQYLAEKTGQLMPTAIRGRWEVLQWLNWQVAGLGPMLGQNHHFNMYVEEPVPYAAERYTMETTRLYNVLNRQLEGREYICGDYSIADIASYPWIVPWKRQRQELDDFANLRKWFDRIRARDAVYRAYALREGIYEEGQLMTEEARAILFGQTDCKPPGS